MNRNAQLHRLNQIYALFDHQIMDRTVTCRRGCAACCTRNVTVTGLEAHRIIDAIDETQRSAMMDRIEAAIELPRFIPTITMNGMADRCAAGQALPEEHADPAWSPCPLLVDDECSIYPARPFHCRCMLSRHDCREHHHADMPDLWIAMNNLFLQAIEHLDFNGTSGNLIDMLNATADPSSTNRIPNRPARILMVPPEHRDRLAPVMDRLQAVVAGGTPQQS